ncbi:MAG: hypothetical protein RLZZ300_2445, partial [Pseudomonadota bacterium]
NSGLKVERRYSLNLTSGRMAQEGTYDYLLDQLINSPEMRQKRIRWRASQSRSTSWVARAPGTMRTPAAVS